MTGSMMNSAIMWSTARSWLFFVLFAAVISVSLIWSASSSNAQQRVVPESREGVIQSFSPVVKRAAPAVVNVYVKRRVKRRVDPFFGRGPLFDRRFGRRRNRVESSLGSGVIVTSQGVVVTNFHVIKGALSEDEEGIKIVLKDKKEYAASVILKDERTDLAILRIRAPGVRFPFLKFGDSDGLEVGDLVLAIGNPYRVGQTVTSGIISALARTRVGISDYQFFIQTDAAINPGNSGGALVNMKGELVGINTAIFSKSGGSNGIGFAIPANMVHLVVQSAINGGRVKRPWFGASLYGVKDTEVALRLGVDRPAGAVVHIVTPNSPAGRGGLQAGDVIVGVDGKKVADPRAFIYHFTTKGLGVDVPLTIIRKGRNKKITVRTEEAPEDPPRNDTWLSDETPFAGLKVANLSPALGEELAIQDYSGVVVIDVKDGYYFRTLGLRRNDIILSVNRHSVKSVKELTSILRRRQRAWYVKFKRGKHIFTAIREN